MSLNVLKFSCFAFECFCVFLHALKCSGRKVVARLLGFYLDMKLGSRSHGQMLSRIIRRLEVSRVNGYLSNYYKLLQGRSGVWPSRQRNEH